MHELNFLLDKSNVLGYDMWMMTEARISFMLAGASTLQPGGGSAWSKTGYEKRADKFDQRPCDRMFHLGHSVQS